MAKDYKHHSIVGPGGIRCPCCNPYYRGNLKSTKRFFNKRTRRKAKEALRAH